MFPHFGRSSIFRNPHFSRGSGFRCVVAVAVSFSLLPFAIGWSITPPARGQSLEERVGKPRPGKPEGSWPNLDEVQREGDSARERQRTAPPPIPSTLRSPKVPLQPWNGRRVGDQIVRAHARKRVSPPPVFEDRKSTRLNSSHSQISYAVFCLKKKTKNKLTSNK